VRLGRFRSAKQIAKPRRIAKKSFRGEGVSPRTGGRFKRKRDQKMKKKKGLGRINGEERVRNISGQRGKPLLGGAENGNACVGGGGGGGQGHRGEGSSLKRNYTVSIVLTHLRGG